MKALVQRFYAYRARRRLERAIREAEVHIITALDHINFGQTMLRAYEKKHAELTAELARLHSPADVRRVCGEAI